MLECKSRISDINKTLQLQEVTPEIRKFMTRDKKTIVYYSGKVINVNNKILTDMINKKKKYLFGSTADQNEYEEIEFDQISTNIGSKISSIDFSFHFDFTTNK
jgi:hypothetical protein